MITSDEAKDISKLINSVLVYSAMAHDKIFTDPDIASKAMRWHNEALKELTDNYGITGTLYTDSTTGAER